MQTRLARLTTIVILVAGVLLVGPAVASAATRDVRLEPGPQTGYRFASNGAILARKSITIATTPLLVASDRRRVVPGHTGIFIRITSGSLAGYEVKESMVAYIPGIAGDTAYAPVATVTFPSGRYLGYRFDGSWHLASTKYAALASPTTATTARRAIIDGRPYVQMATGTWAGTWMPVTAPRGLTASRIACSVGAKPAPGTSVILRRVATTERRLALTFDMGGRMTPALDILERLVIDRVCATILPTGDAAQTTPGTAALAIVKAHPELFEVGNHTMHHCNLRDGGKGALCPSTPPTVTRIQTELRAAETIIRQRSGRDPVPYWRPPYGASDSRVRAAAAAVGYTKTLMWDIDTIDWKTITDGGPTTADIASKVVANGKTGSIVLMHLGGYHTFDALPSMILRLRAGGLQPTTITDLLT